MSTRQVEAPPREYQTRGRRKTKRASTPVPTPVSTVDEMELEPMSAFVSKSETDSRTLREVAGMVSESVVS